MPLRKNMMPSSIAVTDAMMCVFCKSIFPCLFFCVAGNCDYMSNAPQAMSLRFEDVLFFVAHGDRYRVKYCVDALAYKAEEEGAQVALFGHTHQPFAGYSANVMLVNPGALHAGYYAEITVDGNKAEPRLLRLC
jgi:Predicted phosphoesterase